MINKETFMKDFMASIVVFLVALPLCIGIAIASGVPPMLGLISGIIGGLIIAPIAGVPLQVSGPAAGLAVMVFQFVETYGLKGLLVLGVVTGILQIAAGTFRLGQYFRATSPALVKGMLGGIGLLILVSQIHVGLESKPLSNGLKNIIAIPEVVSVGFSQHLPSAMLLVLSIALLALWPKIARGPLSKVPGPLAAVIAGAVLAPLAFPSVSFIHLPDNIFGDLQMLKGFDLEMPSFTMIITALGIGFIASAETLLSAVAVDRLAQRNDSDYNKELIAQGVGNTVAGLLGALPVTGVIVRSSANVASGGMTRMSAVLHGAWLLIFVFMFPNLLTYIPIPSLAAILILVGYKLLDYKGVIKIYQQNKSEFLIYAVTLGIIVGYDLLSGVVAGFLVSVGLLLWKSTGFHFDIHVHKNEGETRFQMKGNASFLHVPKIAEMLPKTPGTEDVIVDLRDVGYVDQAVREQLHAWIASHQGWKERATILLPHDGQHVS